MERAFFGGIAARPPSAPDSDRPIGAPLPHRSGIIKDVKRNLPHVAAFLLRYGPQLPISRGEEKFADQESLAKPGPTEGECHEKANVVRLGRDRRSGRTAAGYIIGPTRRGRRGRWSIGRGRRRTHEWRRGAGRIQWWRGRRTHEQRRVAERRRCSHEQRATNEQWPAIEFRRSKPDGKRPESQQQRTQDQLRRAARQLRCSSSGRPQRRQRPTARRQRR